MRRLMVFISALFVGITLLVVPTAANATTCLPGTSLCQGGVLRHYSPDDGYDADIIVFCNYGAPWDNRKFVAEGTSSQADCGDDTDEVYIRSGEELWCIQYHNGHYDWVKFFDAQGRHKINDFWEESCTLRAD